jgi:hypothetical protein
MLGRWACFLKQLPLASTGLSLVFVARAEEDRSSRIAVFWVMTPSSSVGSYKRFLLTYRLHLQGRKEVSCITQKTIIHIFTIAKTSHMKASFLITTTGSGTETTFNNSKCPVIGSSTENTRYFQY